MAPVGFLWLLFGMILYIVYRKYLGLPLTETVLAEQAAMGPTVEVEYRSILMPIASGRVDDEMTATALKLAAESHTSLVVIYPIEVPLSQPISSPMEAETAEAERELKEAAALGREYGVQVITRIVRTRNVGEAIVEEADRRGLRDHRHRRGAPSAGRAADVRAEDRLRAAARQVPGDGRRPAGERLMLLRVNHFLAVLFVVLGVALLVEDGHRARRPGRLPDGRGLHRSRRPALAGAPLNAGSARLPRVLS